MSYTIRPFGLKDKPVLLQLIRLNTPKYFDLSEEEDFSNYLDNELEDYFVVQESNQIVACGGINYQNHNTAVISWDIVHPDHHKKGIGQQLINFRIELIKNQGTFSRVIVRTSQFTHLFYQKMGFNLEYITESYWGNGIDLYYMSMDLK